ncbi:fumarylacetoacetate hydrolase family protein [Caballeronia sp. SEWSISQ10-4 2]|uniref:2-keto-4-pentenoate hydratase n=1 Tax=Caballeronia sp. SEWSISQ10-4 2 TaxID=2937438 RepID=UPI00264A8AB2|nr:fumarylacetoacetate hydrolase family protein [Caballeronia sp. SEWSISQ10-4 2]MDN7178726.1 fumarylacetoacetate hydrolase family protein [Caballeronia sp. SEWSISQ10-4 2]
MKNWSEFAQMLDEATGNASAIAPLAATVSLTVEDAYAIQTASIARRHARGDTREGVKATLTSRAAMRHAGSPEIIFGWLTEAMRVAEDGDLSLSRYLRPQVQPSVAYIMGQPLKGGASAAEASAAIAAIAPALEIVDSRYDTAEYSLRDMIADNACAAGFILGGFCQSSTNIENLGVLLDINGRTVQIGSTGAILGNPVRALLATVRVLERTGASLQPGDIVLISGATPAHPLMPGDYVCATTEALGRVAFHVTP